MLDQKVIDLIQRQIQREWFSAYLYLDFMYYLEDKSLLGFKNWYDIQAQEERDHARLFAQYLLNQNIRPVLETIERPDQHYQDVLEILNKGLEHEKFVTASIHEIVDAAHEAKDYRTLEFLNWFVKEQSEEETNANELIAKYELFASTPQGLYALDQELGTRVYSPPSLVL